MKDSPGVTAKRTTDPHHFYSHSNLKKAKCLIVKSKYFKASELSWIHFLVVFPTETNAESKYTIYDKSRPKRTVAANFNDIEGI